VGSKILPNVLHYAANYSTLTVYTSRYHHLDVPACTCVYA